MAEHPDSRDDGAVGDTGASDGPVSPDAEDAPGTAVEVELHVHFGMTGSFPLRMGDLFFADDGLYVAEYSYVTPFIGLASKKHRRDAGAMRAVYERYGLDAVLFEADAVYWHSYGNLERVVVHEGGWLGRPKITVYPGTSASHAYRLHDVPAFEEAIADLEACADRHGFEVERRAGLGFSLRESVERFLWKPGG